MIEIQVQDLSGHWFTVQKVSNSNQMVKIQLDQAERVFKKRVRAIDSSTGIPVDIR